MNFIFARFRRQLAALTGIALDADKQYLAESRLSPVMRAHGLADFASLADAFERQENPALTRDVIDSMTTNETQFFRDWPPICRRRRSTRRARAATASSRFSAASRRAGFCAISTARRKVGASTSICARVEFRDFNLLSDYAELGDFDVIFCRNALMYFEPETKRAVLARLSRALKEGGYLFLGATEPMSERNAFFTPVAPNGAWRLRRHAAPQLRLA
ncbi:CheR family methyltransferase [Methylocystis sp. S23]